MPTYTIIIPHYNTPELLTRCLHSIPDEEAIQVIVVDDNSSPEKVDFSHFPGYERSFTQIIYNKDNHGAGRARNLALPHAKGKWLIFADSDDYFTPTAWESFDRYANSEADIVYFNIQSVDSETGEIIHDRGDRYKIQLYQYTERKEKDWEYRIRFWNNFPWGRMIRQELVHAHAITFGETKYGNDVLFSTKTAIAARSIEASMDICYCVTRNAGSLTQDVSMDATLMRYEICLQKNQLLQNSPYKKYQQSVLFFLHNLSSFGAKGIKMFFKLAHQYHSPLYLSLYWHTRFVMENRRLNKFQKTSL